MDIWVFLSVVAVGPIKECRKLAEGIFNGAMDQSPGYPPSVNVFANFDLKNDCTNSRENKNDGNISLQRICAEKVLSLFEQNELKSSDIISMPVELLQKTVCCIPLLVPTTEADRRFNKWGNRKLSLPAAKLNFEKQDQFIQKINELRPDLPSNWTDEINNKPSIVVYGYHKDASIYVDPTTLINRLKAHNMNFDVVGRLSCDWDSPTPGGNHFTKVFVAENHEVVFTRPDLPKVNIDSDHVLIKKYGHLLQEWKEIHDEKRLEFDTKEFGTFKLIYTHRTDD